jgi:hypothetical protein
MIASTKVITELAFSLLDGWPWENPFPSDYYRFNLPIFLKNKLINAGHTVIS